MRVVTVILCGLAIVFFALLHYVDAKAIETYVYLEKDVPKRFIKEIRELGLLGTNEKIKFFYSDGFLDIKKGMYFVTDKHLVLYNAEWDPPQVIIKFEDIVSLDVEYNKSFFEDSFIMVDNDSDWFYEFPVSSEKKRDEMFYDYLLDKANIPIESGYREEDLDVFVELSRPEILRRFEFYRSNYGTDIVAGDYYENIQIPALESLEKKLCREWDQELFTDLANTVLATKGNADETRIVVLSNIFKCQNDAVFTALKKQEDDFILNMIDSELSNIDSDDPDYSKYQKQFDQLSK